MGTVANLVVRVSANIADFEKQIAGLEKSLGRSGARLQSIGRELTVGLTLPLAGVAAAAVKAASDFESSFAGVRKTVDGVVDSSGKLTTFGGELQQKFRDLAKEIPISVNELNRIGESAGQLGIKSENIIGFTKTIAAMGVATNLTSEQAADGMARFSNITQMPQENIERLGSTIVELGNRLAATESEILDFGLRIAGAGEIVGLTEAQILGIAGAFSSVGIEAEAGGTAVQKALLAMNSAVNTGEGLKAFGGAGFAQQFRANPGDAFVGFVDQIAAAGKGGEQLLRNAGFDDARQIRAFLSIAAAGDTLRTSLKLAGDEWARNKALAFEAEQRYITFESKLQLFQNRVNDVGITLGTRLIDALLRMEPSLTKVVEGVTGAVEWFSKLPTPVQDAGFAFAGMFAAVGPVAWALGKIMSASSAVLGFFTKVASMRMPAWFVAAIGSTAGMAALPLGFAAATWGDPDVLGNNVWGGAAMSDDISGMGTDPNAPGARPSKQGDITLDKWNATIDVTTNLTSKFGALSAAAATARAAVGHPGLATGLNEATGAAQRAAAAIAAVEAQFEAADRRAELFYAVVTQDMLRQGVKVPSPATLFSDQVNPLGGLPASGGLLDTNGNRLQVNGPSGMDGAGKSLAELTGPIVPTLAQQVRAGFSLGVQQLGPVVMQALTGGGNVGASIGGLFGGEIMKSLSGRLSEGLSGMFGKTIGGALGSVIPGLGTMLGSMIGPLIGNLAGKIWSGIKGIGSALFGDEESRDVNPARDRILSPFGDVANKGVGGAGHNLAARLTEVTGEAGGGALFAAFQGADTMSELNAAWAAIQNRLAESTSAAQQAISTTDAAADGFNLTLQGSDDALARLGETQERITATMLAGFDNLILKLTEFMATLQMAYAMPMPGVPAFAGAVPGSSGAAPGFTPIASEDLAAGAPNIVINAGTIVGNPEELAMMVTDAWEGGGDPYNQFRRLSEAAVG